MRSRRMSVATALVAVPVLALTASACGSGSDGDNATPTGAASKPAFKPEDAATANYYSACNIASYRIDGIRRAGKPKNAAIPAPHRVEPVELNGERRCEYDSGALVISTYAEKPGKNRLYQAVLSTRQGANSEHAIGGALAKQASGMWFTYHGKPTGGVFQPTKSGVTIVIQTTVNSGYTRVQLNSIAMQATEDIAGGYINDQHEMEDNESAGYGRWG